MEEQRFQSADSRSSGVDQSQNQTEGLQASSAMYSSDLNKYYLDSSLEVASESRTGFAENPAPAYKRGFTGISRRKAIVVSAFITLFVTMMTGASILLLARNSPSKDGNKADIKTQDISLEGADSSDLPPELQGAAQSLLVNGDVITKGTLKVSNNSFVTTIQSAELSSNQTFTLPNGSGTLCLDSNNCAYAASSDLQQLRNELGQIVFPTIPASVLSLNGQTGVVGIQGSLHRMSVSTSNGVLTLSTPQDLDTNSNVQFGSLALTSSSTITANGITFTLPNSGASSQTICTTGITCASGGGLAVILAPRLFRQIARQTLQSLLMTLAAATSYKSVPAALIS